MGVAEGKISFICGMCFGFGGIGKRKEQKKKKRRRNTSVKRELFIHASIQVLLPVRVYYLRTMNFYPKQCNVLNYDLHRKKIIRTVNYFLKVHTNTHFCNDPCIFFCKDLI